MYRRIEEKYKKSSVQNRFAKYYFKTFLILYLIFVIIGLFQTPNYLYFLFIIFIIIIYKRILKDLNLPFIHIVRIRNIKSNLIEYKRFMDQEEDKLIRLLPKVRELRQKQD